jgi:chloride channel 7
MMESRVSPHLPVGGGRASRRRKTSSSPSAASTDYDGYSSDEDHTDREGWPDQQPGLNQQPQKREKRFLIGYSGKTSTRWLLTLITGVTTGVVAIIIVFTIEELIKVRESALTWWEGENFNSTKDYISTFAAFALWNLMLCTVSCALCMTWAPSAVGSGIPQTKAYLNGVAIHSFFNARTFLVKILGTVLSVSSGLCIGPEGPLVHLGAMVGAGLTRTGKLGRKVRALRRKHPRVAEALGMGSIAPPRRGQKPLPNSKTWFSSLIQYLSAFRNDGERRELISIGSACGFAAAFGAPIGAVLFSLEETSTFFNTKMLWRTVVGTMMSTFVVAIYFGKDLGHYGVLSLEGILVEENAQAKNKILELPLYAFIGACGGIMGATFNHFFILLSKRRDVFYKGKHWSWRLVEVSFLSILTSAIQFSLPLICGWSCRDRSEESWADDAEGHNTDPNLAEEDFGNRFDCNTNQTNEMASIFFGSREEAIRNVLADPASFDVRTLLVVGLSFFSLLTITFGCSVPSGLFMPSILIGACLGGAFGVGIQNSGWVYGEGVEPSTFALVGAAAMLGGVQRSTVSLCVILMEGTGQVKFLIPIVVTTVAARYVGDHFNHGFYEIGMAIKGLSIPRASRAQGIRRSLDCRGHVFARRDSQDCRVRPQDRVSPKDLQTQRFPCHERGRAVSRHREAGPTRGPVGVRDIPAAARPPTKRSCCAVHPRRCAHAVGRPEPPEVVVGEGSRGAAAQFDSSCAGVRERLRLQVERRGAEGQARQKQEEALG